MQHTIIMLFKTSGFGTRVMKKVVIIVNKTMWSQ